MNNIQNMAKRLIKISDIIITKIDILSELSYQNNETSNQFKETIEDIKEYLETEKIIMESTSIEELSKIYHYIVLNDDLSDAYSRVEINLLDFLKAYHIQDETGTFEDISPIEDNEPNNEDINTIELDYIIESDNEEEELYETTLTNYIATKAIKKMQTRINKIETFNKEEVNYKKKLIKYFRKFKYYYFTLDNKLELMGAYTFYNIDKMPIIPYNQKIDFKATMNNECLELINNMYLFDNTEKAIDKIARLLFEMIEIEEYLELLDKETIYNLEEYTQKLSEAYNNSYYGNIVKQKILMKKN